MKLRSDVAAAVVTGFILFTMAGAANDIGTRSAWRADEVAQRTWTPASVVRAVWGEREEVPLHTEWVAPPPPPEPLPIWPGAVGKAARALQGIRDSVANDLADFRPFYVTSLADTGAGTLKAIMEDSLVAGAYNVIIPAVSGIIECSTAGTGKEIDVKDGVDNVYYAGHLGPGSGLDLRDCKTKWLNNHSNWVLRNWRSSQAAHSNTTLTGWYGIWVRGGSNWYIDHSAFRWNRYMQLNFTGDTAIVCSDCVLDGVTVANSMIYDADSIQGGGQSAQSLGWSTGGAIDDPGDASPVHQVVHWQNFTMNNGWRNPVVSGDSIFHINNICYNTQRDCGQFNGDFIVDLIGNVSKRGGYNETSDGQSGSWHHVFDGGNGLDDASIYVASLRNIRNGNDWTVLPEALWRGSNRSIAMYRDVGSYVEGDTVPLAWKRDTPLPMDYFEIPIHTPNDAWLDSTLLHVGPSRMVDSLGNWTYVTSTGANIRTFYDSLRVAEFHDSSALELGDGQVPDTMAIAANESMRSGAAIGDIDLDGLSNAFEKRVRGSTDSTSLKPDSVTASGYLVWELYADGKLPSWSPAAPPPADFAPTYRAGEDTVWVRRVAAKDSSPFWAPGLSFPLPIYPESIPAGATGYYLPNAGATSRVMHFTCDSSVAGATPLDSAAAADSAAAMGLSWLTLVATKPTGCD